MPKVIFRPAPTPPPFPPPTPSYDTNSTIKISPFPFETGDDVEFQLPSLKVPNYLYFIISQLDPDSNVYWSISDNINEDVSQPVSSSFMVNIDSYASNDFQIDFFDQEHNIIWNIKATRID